MKLILRVKYILIIINLIKKIPTSITLLLILKTIYLQIGIVLRIIIYFSIDILKHMENTMLLEI